MMINDYLYNDDDDDDDDEMMMMILYIRLIKRNDLRFSKICHISQITSF